ncbi:unknown [Acholeplasma sp. CAG:878]|nr:unknown [Acholeplasma sp. CAG:878]
MYYTNSEIKTAVENWYKTNITDKGFDGKVASGNYFCEQAKVVYNTDFTAGSATVVTEDNYTPSFDCTTDGNGKGVVSGKVGLITVDEVLFAGGVMASSSNFYLKNGSIYWMMSPAGFNDFYAYAWLVDSDGHTGRNGVNSTYGIRPVLNLSADTFVSGSGTNSDPYIVK